jgi:hypothetical protein
MGFSLTQNTLEALRQVQKTPNIVLDIDGVPFYIGALPIRKYVSVGDPGLEIGDPTINLAAFYVGGFNLIDNQENVITFDGTTTSIKQSLNIDKGEGASISNMAIACIDDGTMTEIITPDFISPGFDILQRKARVWLAPAEALAFPDDYFIVFRGVITDAVSDVGKVTFQINSPDDKKRSTIYKRIETKLNGAINNVTTTIVLDSTTNLLVPVLGPDSAFDPAFMAYVKIGDDPDAEIVSYTGVSGFTLTGVTRGQLGTTAQAWSDESQVSSFYRLSDDAMPLALKLLFSGTTGNYVEDIPAYNFNIIGPSNIPNSIFFDGIDVGAVYGIVVGDYITTTGASNGANNVTLKTVNEVTYVQGIGSYVVVDGVSFVDEAGTSAVMDIRSQYDTLPDGLRMGGDEVDVDQHLYLYRTFLSSDAYDIYVKDTIDNAKEFLEKHIYSPIACYSLPRKSKASVGYHSGPVPGQDIVTLNTSNIKNPSKQKLKRSTNHQFFNEIVYKFDEDQSTDRFLSNLITISATSKNRIKGANKTLIIEAVGFRSATGGEARAQLHSNARLSRYQFGAEIINLSTLFEIGFNLEIGDIVVYDGEGLKLPDTQSGEKNIPPRFYEIQNKDFNFKTGDISLEMVDTSFDNQARYCLIGNSSEIMSGISTAQFVVQSSFNSPFGTAEYRKWEDLVDCSVNIRSLDSSVLEDSVIVSASSNTITISPALSFVPSAGMIMEIGAYADADLTDQVKLIYCHMSPLGGGDDPYAML